MSEVAYKFKIKEIAESEIYSVLGVNKPLIKTKTGFKALKIRIMGFLTRKKYSEGKAYLRVEDGSGASITIETSVENQEYKEGGLLDIIGYIKSGGQIKMVDPELVIKVQDPNWLITRKLEILKRIQKMLKSRKVSK